MAVYIAIQLELVSSSLMVDENSGSGGESRKVTLMVIRTDGLTERPVTVFLVTSDDTATGDHHIPIHCLSVTILCIIIASILCVPCFVSLFSW